MEGSPGANAVYLGHCCGYSFAHPNLKTHLFEMIQYCYTKDEVFGKGQLSTTYQIKRCYN